MAVGNPTNPANDPTAQLRVAAPWLFAPDLGTCIVGSHALAIACARAGLPGPSPRDLDLAWTLDVDAGQRLLTQHDACVPTTVGSVDRGTIAAKIGGERIEITTFRGTDAATPLPQRIAADLGARDMSIGAIALELATGTLHDPSDGLADYRQRRIAAVGDPAARVREHPVRWLRYYRKAREWGFELDGAVRRLDLPPAILDALPTEAVTGELRAALLQCPSPGRFLLDLFEAGLLQHLAPELALQFDGRPAGPQRWHPECSQALHLILALEWAVAAGDALDDRDRLTLLVAVLGHDLGKGYTRGHEFPRHLGHEQLGLEPLDRLLQRFPGLADQRSRTLARAVCLLHAQVRDLRSLRSGTLARLYDEHFRAKDFPVALFALAVGADSGGRLGLADSGRAIQTQVEADLHWLRTTCERVDAAALRAAQPEIAAFRAALHEARARAVGAALRRRDDDG